MRKIIISVAGIVLLAIGVILFKYLSKGKEEVKQEVENITRTVFVETVVNKTIPINIIANGNLVAKNKIELYAEVQGVLETTGIDFRPGVYVKKGQTILKINSDEYYATIQSQRSSLQNLIASIMPDIRLDYPQSFQKWVTYLKAFDINKTTPKLPKTLSNQEKLFVTSRNIYTTYFNIKNLEERLTKYNIRAPFNGIVIEANVTKGALVRSGQKIGEFIDPTVYELEVAVNAEDANILKVGKTVSLQSLEKTKSYTGKVRRVNGKIDLSTQTVTIYIQVKGENLREGMFLEAIVPAREEPNAYEVARKLLVNNDALYVVKNNTLVLVEVKPVYFNKNTVVVKGLNNGDLILSKSLPGAYEGQEVLIFKE
jgi:multidrug efflux pump subunit AcrA (membrane-fusion protein)